LLLARSINFDTKTTIFDESLVTQLDPAFEVLPIVRRMMQPIIDKEISEVHAVFEDLGDRFVGILNDVEGDAWNPATDPQVAAPYSPDDLSGKARGGRCSPSLDLIHEAWIQEGTCHRHRQSMGH